MCTSLTRVNIHPYIYLHTPLLDLLRAHGSGSHGGPEPRILGEVGGWGRSAGQVPPLEGPIPEGKVKDPARPPAGFPVRMGTPTTNTPKSPWDRQEGRNSWDNASLRKW